MPSWHILFDKLARSEAEADAKLREIEAAKVTERRIQEVEEAAKKNHLGQRLHGSSGRITTEQAKGMIMPKSNIQHIDPSRF